MTRPVPQPFPDFEILGKIGSGSMGAVFLARQLSLDRLVALKVLKPSLSRDERYVERLSREARLVARLDHPNIVHAYDLRQERGYHFFVMEYVEGRSLRDLLKDWGRLPEEQVLRIGIQVGLALEHARKHGIIHRDIKPANILVQEDGNVKLADLGLAKGPEALSATRHEGEETLGTPLYMSPEQARDSSSADIRSDIYSLGATLFHASCGVPPFRGTNLSEVLTQVLQSPPPSPRSVFPGISKGLDLVLRKCLLKDPARRYQLPLEMVKDLERVQATELPAVEPGELEVRRKQGGLAWTGAGAALLLLALSSYFLLHPGPRPSPPSPPPAARGEEIEKIARVLQAPATTQLIPLIRKLQEMKAAGKKEALPLLVRAQTLFNGRLSQWMEARLEGLRRRLESGRDLARFPLVVDKALDEVFLREFGVPPNSIPDFNLYNWYRARKDSLLREWKAKVSLARARALASIQEKVREVRRKWSQVPGRAFRKRVALARGIFASLPPVDLPDPEAREVEKARARALAELEGEVEAQALNLVRLCREEVLNKEKNFRKRLGDLGNSPGALGEILDQVVRLGAWLRRVAPEADDLPPRILAGGTTWSKELLLARVDRLEKEIQERLAASDRARVEEVARRFRHLMRERDYDAAEKLLHGAGLRTPEARSRLEEMARELDAVKSLEEEIISRIRDLAGRGGNLLVDGVRRKVRFQVCRARPGGGFLLVQDDRGKPLRIEYPRIRRSSLVDLLPPGLRKKRRKAVVLFLLAGDEVARAREEAALLPGKEGGNLLARVEKRAGELRLPLEKRERAAKNLFRELKKKVSLGLNEEALHLADELTYRFWGTQAVKGLKEQIEKLRRKAARGAREEGMRTWVEGLFPGWQVDFSRWPDILATADLRVLSAGELPWRGWDRKPGKGLFSLVAPTEGFREGLARPWILASHLENRFACRAKLRVKWNGSSPPTWALLSFHGIQACLVRPTRHSQGKETWVPFLSSAPRLPEKPSLFLEEAWRAWSSGREGAPLLPGCVYTLELRLGPVEGGVREVTFLLDGASLLGPRILPVKKAGGGTLEFRVQGEVQVLQLTLQGRPWEKGKKKR